MRCKVCSHFGCCEAAKSGDKGADRGSVGETEELDHICAALVTALTLGQSPHKSRTLPLGRPARPPFVFLCSLVSGAAPAPLPEGSSLVGIDVDRDQTGTRAQTPAARPRTPEQAVVARLCFLSTFVASVASYVNVNPSTGALPTTERDISVCCCCCCCCTVSRALACSANSPVPRRCVSGPAQPVSLR